MPLSDFAGCREQFDKYVGTDDAAFDALILEAERSILIDLRSPQVRKEIWAAAKPTYSPITRP
jgi:hypothetical protein